MRLRCTHNLTMMGAGLALLAGTTTASAQQQWVNFQNETSARSIADPAIFASDTQEKHYAFADLNKNGWTDLVIVRKQPFTSTGRRTNVLMMNEGGVLVDRTAEYASQSDVPGDQGFLTPTNDRWAELVDVNGNGWLDIVTAVTLGDNLPKHISHPRVYINLGNDDNGNWLGFRHEDARIPQFVVPAGFNQGAAPRFCSIAVGDFTGNGAPDLYFGDYDSGEAGPQLFDFNNRLLINDGNGFFTDESTSRMTNAMLNSAFGAAGAAADFNQDGAMDIVKQTALAAPQHVAIIYNNVNDPGFFFNYNVIYSFAPYFVSVGDLNNNGRPDLVITDDGQDRFMINQGPTGPNSIVNWTTHSFQYSGSSDQGFGSDSHVVDLNNSGWNDVIIADVDVDIPGCNRRAQIYRNEGGQVGGVPTLRETVIGGTVASIPTNMLVGTFDVAAFDINNNGWVDLVIGRCTGTQIWMNQPPFNIQFSFPEGRPELVSPSEGATIVANIAAVGEGLNESSVRLVGFTGKADEAFDIPMSNIGDSNFAADLPIGSCGDSVSYRVVAELDGGAAFAAPSLTSYYTAVYADGFAETLDTFAAPSAGWTVNNDASLTSGAWEQGAPNGTLFFGSIAAPFVDATPDNGAWLTGISTGGPAAATTVRNGGTELISPALDFGSSDGTISFARWFFTSNSNRTLDTYVSNDDGNTWVLVTSTNNGGQEWETVEFTVSDFVEPTSTVRVRFATSNPAGNGFVEAGIDDFAFSTLVCDPIGTPCLGDLTGSGVVDVSDLGVLLSAFGISDGGDLNGDGITDISDLSILLSVFGTVCD